VVKRTAAVFAPIFAIFLILTACGKRDNALKVGHSGGNLFAALYVAQDSLEAQADIHKFNSSSDIAYSLLSGTLDVGFVEADKLAFLANLPGFDKLTVVGKVTYPYGATLILRKGLDVRLQELDGLTIAVSAPKCVLLDEFKNDAQRFGADISNVKFEYMPFNTMLPALAAGTDAAIIKGTYAVSALHEGHTILYQNWEVEPGDECCPAIIDQAALVLLARRDKLDAAQAFAAKLLKAQEFSPDELRRAVANHTAIPFEVLQGQPVPEFSLADDKLLETFLEAEEEHGEHEDEDENDE
jgi:ABC-type nitrate/sulfonate/bicarbonate transport system substrate-binding protein